MTQPYSIFNAVRLAAAPLAQRRGINWGRMEFGVEEDADRRLSMTALDAASGGILVPHEVLIDKLVPQLGTASVTQRLGARLVAGLTGALAIPTDEGWGAGDPVSDVASEAMEGATDAHMHFGAIELSPKLMTISVPLSWGFMTQTRGAGESVIERILARRFAFTMDRRALFGAGGVQPVGIANMPGVNEVSFSGATYTGASQTATNLLDDMIWLPLEEGGDEGSTRIGWLGEPAVGRKLSFAKTSTGARLHMPNTIREVRGLPAIWSRLARVSWASAGTSAAQLFAGDWSRMAHYTFGALNFRAVEIDDDARRGRVHLIASIGHDCKVTRPEAFSRAGAFSAALS